MPIESATTQLIYRPDWPDTAALRLLSGWDRPKIRAWMQALGEGAQQQEDDTFDLLTSTIIETATGDALDQWGELVGEQRLGLSDAEYRQFVLARMLVNRSAGNADSAPIDDLIEILDVATEPNVDVWHQDNFPAGLYLVTERLTFMTEETRRRVGRLMEDARPGGRHMTVIESVTGGFGFEDDPTAEGFGVGPFSRLIEPG